MTSADFMDRAKKAGLAVSRFEKALCYLKLTGYRELRENWQFYCSRDDISEIAKSGKVQILKDLEVTGGTNEISRQLSNRGLVCFVSDRDRATLRAKCGLPVHFQAYALSDRFHGKANYTIAFGRSALLLETLIWHWKPQQEEGWIC
jgi:CRISPR-associated endonuclease/helicase Cas3